MDISSIYNRIKSYYSHVAKTLYPAIILPPLRLTFEVTYRCNLNCPFCFQETARKESPEFQKNFELSNEEMLDVIDSLPKLSLVTFNGGEVFVRKDFPDLLRQVSQRGRRFNIVTNGTMLFGDKVSLLVDETRALSVGISIDGIGETHDNIRRLPKAFERTVENMKGLAAYRESRGKRFPVIDMKTVITKENLEQLVDIYLLARDIGADYVTYSCLRTSELLFALPCRASMDDEAYKEFPPSFAEPVDLALLKKQLESISALALEGKPFLRFYPDYREISGILKYNANQGELADYEPCRAPWTNIRIAPNGDVYPCLSYRMGNIRNDELSEIWKSEKMNYFRSKLEKDLMPACLGCCFLKGKTDIKFEMPQESEEERTCRPESETVVHNL